MKSKTPDFNHLQRLAVTSSVTVTNILVFGGLGYWLDKTLNTKPWFLIGLLVLSFPITFYEIYKIMTKTAEKQLNKKSR